MIVWPLRPNWKSPYRETFSYLTEIITSEIGSEQRRAWRQAARRSVSYDTLVSRDRFQALRRTLAAQGGAVAFPDERTRAVLSAAADQGQSVTIAQPPSWLAVGRRVVLEHPQTRDRAALLVGAVDGDQISFTSTSGPWPAGTRVMPAFVGRMAQSIRVGMVSSEIAQTPIELSVEPGTEIEEPTLPRVTLGGVEVLTHRPNWAERIQVDVRDPTEWTDNEMGVRAPYVAIPFQSEVIQASHVIRSSAELDQVLGLFQRNRGRCGEMYVPTWTNDFTLTANTEAGSSVLGVAGWDFHDAYANDGVHRAFQIRFADKSIIRCRVAAITKSDVGPPVTYITTVEPMPRDILHAEIEAISWLLLSRFASDDMTVEWVTDRHATIVANTISTENRL